jgi:hypothetical protein
MKIKNLIVSCVILTATFFTFASSSQAQSQNSLLFGQIHRYSVVFRGNGEAIVYARIVLTNPSTTSVLNQLQLQPGSGQLTNFTAFQQVLPQQCLQYGSYGYGANNCAKYGDPDYSPNNYYGGYGSAGGQTQYYSLNVDQSNGSYQITLSQPIAPNKSGAVILSYIATGYVKKSALGLYTFNFETLKATDRISDIQVSADVDSDLLLKGKRSQVNYNMPSSGLQSASAGASLSNPMLDTLSSQIGSYGPIVKTAKGLAPGETLTVKGEYAASWWTLYLNSIIWVLLIVAALIVGTYWFSRYLKQRKTKAQAVAPLSETSASPTQPSAYHSLLFPTMGAGLAVAVLVIGLNYLISSLGGILNSSLDSLGGMSTGIVLIVIILLYGLILVGPAIWFGAKMGWKAVILVIVFEIVWLIILGLLITLLFQSGTNAYPGYYPGGGLNTTF